MTLHSAGRIWMLLLAFWTIGRTSPVRADDPCSAAISADTAQRLFAILNHPPSEPNCRFVGVQTRHSQLEARWTHDDRELPPLVVTPRECTSAESMQNSNFVVETPKAIVESCPSVVALISAFEQQVRSEHAATESGSTNDPLYRGVRWLLLSILLLCSILCLFEARTYPLSQPRWAILASAGFAAALALRCTLPFSLGNWYSEVLPANGPPPWMRFGPGIFAFQSLLRDIGVWGPMGLTTSQLTIGSLAIPLIVAAAFELGMSIEGAAATAILLTFSPFHARISATSSEHVLASTLCLLLLVAWLRAARTGNRLWLLLAGLLIPTVLATRIDMAVSVAAALLWPLLRDRDERARSAQGRVPWRQASVLAMVAALAAVGSYLWIAGSSHHPLPELDGSLLAMRSFLEQFWTLAVTEPGWISYSSVILALLGSVFLALQRPWLLARIVLSLLIIFVGLGRLLVPDEIPGARYFLFALMLFLLAGGVGFEGLLQLVPRPWRRVAAGVGLGILALWNGIDGLPAYRVRFAFQDEHRFLREALRQLPAGCTVYSVPIRDDQLPRDLDCCLDMPRSPLVLDFPNLRLRHLPENLRPVSNEIASGCVAYYESITCSIRDEPADPSTHATTEIAVPLFQRRCADIQHLGRLVELGHATVSPRATLNLFHGNAPTARLYRWQP